MILPFIFTFLGSLMITCGLEVLYNFEWNFLEVICSSYQCLDANMNKEASMVAYLVTLFSFALGFGIQIPTILKLHKKKPPVK
ncbi:hypothetical protein THOM_0376 [Trachipleistophora hominis]|uniref:Uncharacterized protein n=1 Tax=Trachipleistophora hominis TaxID=72359 RepID=L7K0F7_TRAHO|nr:hypothetical protein THOM_0376 [Trachipleistophora hominis]